jgi:uncharacterized membrane protein
MKNKVRNLVQGALIASLYVVLTLVARALGLDSGAIQIRFSEALCILPYFTAAAVPGVFIGCLLSNIILSNVFWDILFGSIATLIGAYAAYLLRKRKWLVPIPTILSNTVIIPFVLRFAYGIPGSIAYFMLTVGVGEIISCGVMGMLLLSALEKHRYTIFKNGNE